MNRNGKGQFQKGESGNPKGRPKRDVERTYLEAMAGVVSLDDWCEIVTKALAQAKRGDPVARKWLSDYLMGTPVNRNEHSGADGGPLEIVVRHVRS